MISFGVYFRGVALQPDASKPIGTKSRFSIFLHLLIKHGETIINFGRAQLSLGSRLLSPLTGGGLHPRVTETGSSL